MIEVTEDMMEQAARNLCALRKIDPDLVVEVVVPGAANDEGTLDLVHRTQLFQQWQLARGEVLAFMQMQQAVTTGFAGLDVHGRPVKRIILTPH